MSIVMYNGKSFDMPQVADKMDDEQGPFAAITEAYRNRSVAWIEKDLEK